MKTSPSIMKQYDIPSNAAYLGYVIFLPERDEFMAYCQKAHGLTQRAFTRSLDHAKIYHSLDEVYADARLCREATEPCYLYDESSKRLIARSDTLNDMMNPDQLKKQLQEKHYRKVLNPEKYGKPERAVFGQIARDLRHKFKLQLR